MIDLWAKLKKTNATFADVTWMCSIEKPFKNIKEIFYTVLNARDNALSFIKNQLIKRKLPKGKQIDRVVRSYISSKGYGKFFLHKTGHVLGFYSDHGKGTNLARNSRNRIKLNTGYTIEPGIYLRNKFGVRSEIDFYIDKNFKLKITTDQQKKMTII